MKNIYLLMVLIVGITGFAQSGINTTNPNTNADLELGSTDKGLLINRVALTGTASAAPLGGHVAGMVVYNTATAGNITPGFYYNNGSSWVRSSSAAERPWLDADNIGVGATSSSNNLYLPSGKTITVGTTVPASSSVATFSGGDMTLDNGISHISNSSNGNGLMVFDADGAETSTVTDFASIAGLNGGLSLSGDFNATINPHLFVSNAGDVGIGTSTPATKLEVNGHLTTKRIVSDFSTSFDVWIQGGAIGSTGTARNIAMIGEKSNDRLSLNWLGEFTGGTYIQGPKTFIQTQLGVNTTDPGATLHVVGSIEASSAGGAITGSYYFGTASRNGVLINPGGIIGIQRNSNNPGIYLSKPSGNIGDFVRFSVGGSYIGSISTNGSSIAYNTTSDRRLKENFTPVTEALKRLNQIEVSNYNFISKPSVSMDGFIAQQLQPIIPEAVTGDPTGDVKTAPMRVDYSKVVPLLTAAVQELSTKNNSLQVENEALKARLLKIEKKLGM